MQKLSATLPDGKIVTRKTEHPYTHIIAVREGSDWGVIRWTQTPMKAMSAIKSLHPMFDEFKLIPVDKS